MNRKTLFLTGANGFVGSNVLSYVLYNTGWDVICPTTSLHHGSQDRIYRVLEDFQENLETVEEMGLKSPDPRHVNERVNLVRCDLSQPFSPSLFGNRYPDYIWNIASESHVDRSLKDPVPFVENNVRLILNVLEYTRKVQPRVFLNMSTDEVFGPAPEGYSHHEWDEIKPSNPYSASKAAQESICYSYWRAYNIPLVLTNTMNLIAPGPGYQSSEKFVPKVVKKILDNETVDIHATPEGVSGSRCWIDVRDFAEAWHFLTTKLEDDPNLRYYPNMPDRCIRYNIVGPEASNLEVAQTIARIMGKELNYKMVNFHQSRPGHDPRYSLDGSKLRDFGWTPRRSLDETLRDIVTWYLDNPETLEE